MDEWMYEKLFSVYLSDQLEDDFFLHTNWSRLNSVSESKLFKQSSHLYFLKCIFMCLFRLEDSLILLPQILQTIVWHCYVFSGVLSDWMKSWKFCHKDLTCMAFHRYVFSYAVSTVDRARTFFHIQTACALCECSNVLWFSAL